MKGETVKVKTFSDSGADPFGAPTSSESVETVDDVLIQVGACADLFESNRPSGAKVRYTLHFPKTFSGDLEGAEIEVRGSWHKVIGHPDHLTLENTPTRWWMAVEVGSVNG